MQEIATLVEWIWRPLLQTLLGFSAGTAAVALISPKLFERVSSMTNRGCNLSEWIAKLEQPIDADRFLRPYCRVLGGAALVVVTLVGWKLMP